MTRLAEVIARLHPLPSPRGVALELANLMRREDASVAAIARIVQADPALAGRLIHAANAAGAGPGSRTGSLGEAVLRLGLDATRQIALGFSLVADYRSGACSGFDYAAFWTGSLLRGVAAQIVAARARGFDPREAFVCGLLADVGELALATAQPEAYAELLGHAGQMRARLRRAERERFGIDHAELCVELLQRWTLPAALVQAVRDFHARAVQRPATWLLTLAEAIARGAAAHASPAWQQVALDAAARLGFGAGDLNVLAGAAVREAAQWAPLLALPVAAVAAADYQEYASPARAGDGMVPTLSVVIADDNDDDRDLMRHALVRAGHSVHAVASGQEALEAFLAVLPQMIIADWDMPKMDGVALCRTLRATRLGRDLYVILHTARAGDRDLTAGIEAGADDFVAKSAGHDVLLARVSAGARAVERQRIVAGEFRAARRLAVELAGR